MTIAGGPLDRQERLTMPRLTRRYALVLAGLLLVGCGRSPRAYEVHTKDGRTVACVKAADRPMTGIDCDWDHPRP